MLLVRIKLTFDRLRIDWMRLESDCVYQSLRERFNEEREGEREGGRNQREKEEERE